MTKRGNLIISISCQNYFLAPGIIPQTTTMKMDLFLTPVPIEPSFCQPLITKIQGRTEEIALSA